MRQSHFLGYVLTAMRRSVPLAIVIALVVAGCGGDDGDDLFTGVNSQDPGPIHVHGLGVNPEDGALFIATHTGLFRAPEGQRTAERVADRFQDTMGFTIVGPDRFLGSGHPDVREDLPPFLGLIRSSDAGENWDAVSLMGEADFHVLEASGNRVYGFGSDFETQTARFLVSEDSGRTWDKRSTPGPLISLAIAPDDPDRIVATAEEGVYSSDDAGDSWRPLTDDTGLVAWTRSGSLVLVDASGGVTMSGGNGRSWQKVGAIGGEPAALEAAGNDLYVALHDGTIKQSTDGGNRWTVRSQPRAAVIQ